MAAPITRVPGDGSRWRRPVTGAAAAGGLVVLGVAGTGVALVALGALVPAAGVLGVLAPLVVPVYGPALVVVAVVSAIAAGTLRRRLPRAAVTVSVVGVVAAVALGAVVGIFVATTVAAGGSVDPWRAVVPSGTATSTVDDRPVYTTTPEGQALHLAIQRPVGGGGGAPVIVYVHGGGWIGGSDLGRAADLREFAEQGWLTVGVEYTLARPGRPTWDVAGPEVACALTQVAARAASYGGDPSRIVLAGDSAGGQLAVSVGYHAATGDQPSSCGGQVPVPRGVAVNYPAVDLVDGYEHGSRSSQPSLDARYLAVAYTGGTPAQVPDRYRAISGAAAISRAAPPTLVIGPTRDVLVPPPSLVRFVHAARQEGVDATLVELPFANHAYDTFGHGTLGQQAAVSLIEHWSRQHAG